MFTYSTHAQLDIKKKKKLLHTQFETASGNTGGYPLDRNITLASLLYGHN